MRGMCVVVFAAMFAAAGCSDSSSAPATLAPLQAVADPGTTQVVEAPVARLPRFSVATFNVNYANQDWDEALAVLRTVDVELICLQETTPELERFLRTGLSDSHRHAFFSQGKGELYAERFAFFSRAPLKDVNRVPRTDGLFDAWIARLEVDNREFQVANVHLQPVVLPASANPLAAVSAIQSADGVRLTEIESIVKALDVALPRIIVGDFNSHSGSKAYAAMRTHGLIDCLAELHADADRQVTWKWPTPWGEGALRIDYLWRDERWRTDEVQVIPTKGSDHNVVWGRFELLAP